MNTHQTNEMLTVAINKKALCNALKKGEVSVSDLRGLQGSDKTFIWEFCLHNCIERRPDL